MTIPRVFGRIEVEDVNDVTIVRFVDRRIGMNIDIDALGDELYSLVDEFNKKRLVLDFSGVEFFSSEPLNRFVIMNTKVKRAKGKLVLCSLVPELYEVFEITRLNKTFAIQDNLHDALKTFGYHVVQIACPVRGCGGWISSSRASTARAAGRLLSEPWMELCPGCEAKMTVWSDGDLTRLPVQADVLSISIPTYMTEQVQVICEAGSQSGSSRIAGPYRLSLTGRLDLFSSEVLERAWQTVPEPRRVVVDLRHTTEISEPGVLALLGLCTRKEGDSKTSILINKKDKTQRAAFSGCAFAFHKAKAAVHSLGRIPKNAKRPLCVTIRLDQT